MKKINTRKKYFILHNREHAFELTLSYGSLTMENGESLAWKKLIFFFFHSHLSHMFEAKLPSSWFERHQSKEHLVFLSTRKDNIELGISLLFSLESILKIKINYLASLSILQGLISIAVINNCTAICQKYLETWDFLFLQIFWKFSVNKVQN